MDEETLEQMSERLFEAVRKYVDARTEPAFVERVVTRIITAKFAEREGQFLRMLEAMELRLATLERQATSHKDHLARLQKRLTTEAT